MLSFDNATNRKKTLGNFSRYPCPFSESQVHYSVQSTTQLM